MKLKNFRDLVEQHLTKKEIAEIERRARAEVKILKFMQERLKKALDDYMRKNKIGFNELVKQLNSNPRQVTKIQRGHANLTLASVAHIAAFLGQDPQDLFKSKK